MDEKPQKVELPLFRGPGDLVLWLKQNANLIGGLSQKDKIRLLHMVRQTVSLMPASERDFLLQIAQKLKKEVKAHA